jgi:hypothetical protein
MTVPAVSRGASLGLAFLLAVLGCFLLYVAGDGLGSLIGGVSIAAEQVVVRTGAAAAIPAAMMLLALAALVGGGRGTSDRNARRLFGFVLVCAPFLLLMPSGLFVATNLLLPGKGYRPCSRPEDGQRYLVVTWVHIDEGRSGARRSKAGATKSQSCRLAS